MRPRCEDTNLRSARPISGKTVELCFRHSISKSCNNSSMSNPFHTVWRMPEGRKGQQTSMSRFSSILTARPNVKIHCARFANSHVLRMRSRRVGSLGLSTASISSRPRFLDETILGSCVATGVRSVATKMLMPEKMCSRGPRVQVSLEHVMMRSKGGRRMLFDVVNTQLQKSTKSR